MDYKLKIDIGYNVLQITLHFKYIIRLVGYNVLFFKYYLLVYN